MNDLIGYLGGEKELVEKDSNCIIFSIQLSFEEFEEKIKEVCCSDLNGIPIFTDPDAGEHNPENDFKISYILVDSEELSDVHDTWFEEPNYGISFNNSIDKNSIKRMKSLARLAEGIHHKKVILFKYSDCKICVPIYYLFDH